MKRHRRRAMSILHILALLPLIAGVSTVCYEIIIHSVRFQWHTQQRVTEDDRLRDLVRRIQQDAADAEQASVPSSEASTRLELAAKDRRVVYEAAGARVSRTEQASGREQQSFVVSLRQTRLQFSVEQIASSPGIVWITWTELALRESGPPAPRQMATAVRVGRGVQP